MPLRRTILVQKKFIAFICSYFMLLNKILIVTDNRYLFHVLLYKVSQQKRKILISNLNLKVFLLLRKYRKFDLIIKQTCENYESKNTSGKCLPRPCWDTFVLFTKFSITVQHNCSGISEIQWLISSFKAESPPLISWSWFVGVNF